MTWEFDSNIWGITTKWIWQSFRALVSNESNFKNRVVRKHIEWMNVRFFITYSGEMLTVCAFVRVCVQCAPRACNVNGRGRAGVFNVCLWNWIWVSWARGRKMASALVFTVQRVTNGGRNRLNYTRTSPTHIAQSSCHVAICTLISSVFSIEYGGEWSKHTHVSISDAATPSSKWAIARTKRKLIRA